MKFFQYNYDSGLITLEEESLLLIKEFNDLLEPKRNITKEDKTGKRKERAFREFKYLYLFYDGKSPYFSFPEQERHKESLIDAGITPAEYEDLLFKEACRKYDKIENSSLELRLLKAAMIAVENQINYLENVDLSERDPMTGKPIFKSKDLIAEIKGCKDLITSLRELEMQVKKGVEVESTLRGNVDIGMFD